MIQFIRVQLTFFFLATVVTGIAYPMLVTLVAQVCFSEQANGSLVYHGDVLVGSRLIGQDFTSDRYFWGRPSATADKAYNAAASGGSNLGPSNPKLLEAVQLRRNMLDKGMSPQDNVDQKVKANVPIDLVTSSASGLDPDISVAAALYQIQRVAKARSFDENELTLLVKRHIQPRQFGLLGEPRVNVLALNMDLDTLTSKMTAIDP